MRRLTLIALLLVSCGAGAEWQRFAMPPVYFGITKMEFANENYGCALGNDDNDPANFLVFGNGAWVLTSLPGMYIGTATDVSFLPSGYGWVAGRYMGMNRALYTARRQPGIGWVFIHNPYENGPMPAGALLVAVSVAAEEDFWILFRLPNYLLHYKDGVWQDFPNALPAAIGYAQDIFFVNPNDGWVAGSGGFAHYVNGTWEYVAGPSVGHLDFPAAYDGWAIDYDGPNVYHYNGSSWVISLTASGGSAVSVSFCDSNNGWACLWESTKGATVYKYDNNTWHRVAPPNTVGLGQANSVSPTCAWFRGEMTGNGPYTNYTYRWTTGSNVEPTSLGRIKASFK